MIKKTDLNTQKSVLSDKYNRIFSETYKRQKIKDYESKLVSIKDLSEICEVSRTTIYKWIYLYSTKYEKGIKTVVQMESEAHKTKILLQRVADLERKIGQQQMEIDFQNKVFELISHDLGYDVKKKHSPQGLNGIERIGTSMVM